MSPNLAGYASLHSLERIHRLSVLEGFSKIKKSVGSAWCCWESHNVLYHLKLLGYVVGVSSPAFKEKTNSSLLSFFTSEKYNAATFHAKCSYRQC